MKSQFSKHSHWEDIKKISQILTSNGFVSVLVGGGVRDAYLGREVKDFDLATSATPEDIQKIFPKAKTLWSDYAVTLVPYASSKGHAEVTTFRKESGYEDGRRPQNVEHSSMEEDVRRRDFTMNALYYDIQKDEIIDLVQGLKDINNKIIKTVGLPEQRFLEDHLRILRALRFSHQLDFSIEEQTKKACQKYRDSINSISQERKTQEVLKMFSGNDSNQFAKGLKLLDDYKMLDLLFALPSQKPKNPYAFWQMKSQFLNQAACFWTLIGFPYFFHKRDKEGFSHFLEKLKLKSSVSKEALLYFENVNTLLSPSSSFTQKILALSDHELFLEELCMNFLNSSLNFESKNFMKFFKNKQDIRSFKSFLNQYHELKNKHGGEWPEAKVTGTDLLSKNYDNREFTKLLLDAYNYQLENPKATKQDLLIHLENIRKNS